MAILFEKQKKVPNERQVCKRRLKRESGGSSTQRCNEGADYAGGMVSSDIDGLRIAEASAPIKYKMNRIDSPFDESIS
jgi:hypothetical protein